MKTSQIVVKEKSKADYRRSRACFSPGKAKPARWQPRKSALFARARHQKSKKAPTFGRNQ
jgi:hypothetical protein